MKVFEKIGRVVGDVTDPNASADVKAGLALFVLWFIVLIGVIFGPIAAALVAASPFAGVALLCMMDFLKALSRSVRKHFFEK